MHQAAKAKTVEKNISASEIYKSWVMIFILKLIFAFVFCQFFFRNIPERQLGSLSYASGDHHSYMGAMENYISTGQYFFMNERGDTIKAGRLPHFAIPYWLFRQAFSPALSADLSTVMNIALDVSAIVCMSLLVFSLLSASRKTYYLALFLGIISNYVSNWAFNTVPDGPAASLMMIGIFYLWKAFKDSVRTGRQVFLASLFFTWAIVLRPYLIALVAVMALLFLLHLIKKQSLRVLLKCAVIAVLPLLFFVTPWVIRNYYLSGKIIPFQQDMYAGYGYYPSELSLRKLITLLGEDGSTYWSPSAMGAYFYPVTSKTSTFRYPEYLKNDAELFQKIENIRLEYIAGFSKRSEAEEESLANKIGQIEKRYKVKYAFRYYFFNHIRRIFDFWMHSGSSYLPAVKTGGLTKVIMFANKLLQSALYFLVLFLGTWTLWKKRKADPIVRVLLAPIIILTILLPVIFRVPEARYALSFYYPCLIGLSLWAGSLRVRFWNKNLLGLFKNKD